MIRKTLLLLICMISTLAYSQYKVTGVVIDSKDAQPLPGATATVTAVGSSQPEGQSSDLDGNFSIKVSNGKYLFKVVYLGYTTYEKNIEVKGADIQLGKIRLKSEDKRLDEVKVAGVMQRQEQRGDTTIFNAEAFKVNPDATTEDLIKKMPGMVVEGSEVKAGGQSVKKVLVDGKEFFGDDPMMALRNIDADMVKNIEVYDRQSDQSEFTGFNDGNDERTINILTKMGINKGSFGRVYAGYGTDDRYEAGGNFNVFTGNHRITLLGNFNNINQQGYSQEDMSSAMGGGMGGGMMGGMMGGGMRGGMFGAGGKNRTNNFGINYTYDKENKLKIQVSYQFSNSKNVSDSKSTQEYFTDSDLDSLRVNSREQSSDAIRNGHNFSLRLEYQINDKNSIIFTPRIRFSDNENSSWSLNSDGYYANQFAYENDGLFKPYSMTSQNNSSESTSISGSGNLLWRHKFNVDRRTLSLQFSSNISDSNSDQTSKSDNEYAAMPFRNLNMQQITDNDSKNNRFNASLQYTEPIGEYMALQVNYSPSITLSDGDRSVKADTAVAGTFSGNYVFSPALSNVMDSKYIQHRAGAGLNIFNSKGLNATLGLDYQKSTLKGEQDYPYEFETDKSYQSIMPSARIQYRNGSFNMNFNYRTSTSAPSISQLQKTVDVSNIRKYSAGNENLDQSYTHNVFMMVSKVDPQTQRFFSFFGMYSATIDDITTSSVIAKKDSVVDYGVILPAGTEYSKPINMNGSYNANVNITLSTPVSLIRSNVNFNLGAMLSSRPSMYNYRKITSDNYSLSGGVTIGSNISESLDFTISYRGNYNIVKNEAAAASNYNYYSHTISLDLNCLFWQRLVFTNNVANQLTSGMGEGYDNNYIMWNAAVGFKFCKDRRAELRLKLNDILNNNTSVSRSISDAYVETSTTDVLKQYLMLTFTYKFKQIGNLPNNGGFGPFGGGAPGGRGGRRGGMMGGPMF